MVNVRRAAAGEAQGRDPGLLEQGGDVAIEQEAVPGGGVHPEPAAGNRADGHARADRHAGGRLGGGGPRNVPRQTRKDRAAQQQSTRGEGKGPGPSGRQAGGRGRMEEHREGDGCERIGANGGYGCQLVAGKSWSSGARTAPPIRAGSVPCDVRAPLNGSSAISCRYHLLMPVLAIAAGGDGGAQGAGQVEFYPVEDAVDEAAAFLRCRSVWRSRWPR